jgi:hypothetical protein
MAGSERPRTAFISRRCVRGVRSVVIGSSHGRSTVAAHTDCVRFRSGWPLWIAFTRTRRCAVRSQCVGYRGLGCVWVRSAARALKEEGDEQASGTEGGDPFRTGCLPLSYSGNPGVSGVPHMGVYTQAAEEWCRCAGTLSTPLADESGRLVEGIGTQFTSEVSRGDIVRVVPTIGERAGERASERFALIRHGLHHSL